MARWEPDSRTRMQDAAVALIAERGFDAVTAAEIAAAAGVTERTFFRHFRDKREAVFANEEAMQAALVEGVATAPDGPPDALLAAGLHAVAAFLEPRRAPQRERMALVDAHPALREREVAKQFTTATVLADALAARGVDATTAALAGRVGIAVLSAAYERWLAPAATATLAALVGEDLDRLAALAR